MQFAAYRSRVGARDYGRTKVEVVDGTQENPRSGIRGLQAARNLSREQMRSSMPGTLPRGAETMRATGTVNRVRRRDRRAAPHWAGAPPASRSCALQSFRLEHRSPQALVGRYASGPQSARPWIAPIHETRPVGQLRPAVPTAGLDPQNAAEACRGMPAQLPGLSRSERRRSSAEL